VNVTTDHYKLTSKNKSADNIEILYKGQDASKSLPPLNDKEKLFDFVRNYPQNCKGSVDKFIVYPYANIPDFTDAVLSESSKTLDPIAPLAGAFQPDEEAEAQLAFNTQTFTSKTLAYL